MPTTPPPITPAPPAPIRHEKATFSDRVDAFVTWLVAFVTQIAALALNVRDNAKEAYDSAVVAANWAGISTDKALEATQRAANANDAVIAAAASVNAAPWVSGATYQQFQRVLSPINFRIYVKTTTAGSSSGGATDPANDPVNWQPTGLSSMPGGKRTSSSMLKIADMGSYIELSGTFTQSFDLPAGLGAGWCVWLRNAGSGDITIPSSDGRTNWVMYPGEARLFQCDGVLLRSLVVRPFHKVFATTQNFIKPPGYPRFRGRLWGGAGSGAVALGASANGSSGGAAGAGGGAGGGCNEFDIPESMLADVELVTIGAGGLAVSRSAVNAIQEGNPGGQSSFAGLTAEGGSGGGLGSNQTSGGGSNNNSINGSGARSGESAFLGGAGGAHSWSASLRGTSKLGGNGGVGMHGNEQTPGGVVGQDGSAPAGGGGGASARHSTNDSAGVSARSGAGARGELQIWGVA